MNPEVLYEQALLSRCADDDRLAIQEFDNRSYLGTILIAVHEANTKHPSGLTAEELVNICKMLIGSVYRASQTLPNQHLELKSQLAKYIPVAFAGLVKLKPS
jgi:hypothetical protein